MEFIAQAIQDYSESHTQHEPEILKELNRETHLKVLKPRMLSGHLQGRVLSLFTKMIKPKAVLEIGTYTGYSAICMAEGMSADSKLITIDINEELEGLVSRYVAKAGYEGIIEPRIGNALDIIPTLDYTWDLVFIDADKVNYAHYYDLVIDKMAKGGFIIADNVLWSGKVIQEVKASDTDTKALKDFNKKVHQDDRVENFLLPIRDGLMILRKL